MTEAYTQQEIGRFWGHVKISGPDECWLWQAGSFEKGYGAFARSHTNTMRAHRVAFELVHRPLRPEEVVRHTCDNPPCCNPNHLLPGTQQDNVNDRNARGRQARGELVNTSKLTELQVQAIRSDQRSQRTIAKERGVCKSTIGYIKRGEHWRSVT